MCLLTRHSLMMSWLPFRIHRATVFLRCKLNRHVSQQYFPFLFPPLCNCAWKTELSALSLSSVSGHQSVQEHFNVLTPSFRDLTVVSSTVILRFHSSTLMTSCLGKSWKSEWRCSPSYTFIRYALPLLEHRPRRTPAWTRVFEHGGAWQATLRPFRHSGFNQITAHAF